MKNKKIFFLVLFAFVLLFLFLVFPQDIADNDTKESEKTTEEPMKEQELFERYYKEAEKELEDMSLEEKIGQLFLVRFDNTKIESTLAQTAPSGYVLFAKDIENKTKDSLKQELDSYQTKAKVNLIFAVDEEGGTVTRISRFPAFRSEKFKSVRDYYLEGGIPLLLTIEEEKEVLLKEVGINLNLAPVADVSTNPDDYIYNRTLGEKTEIVSDYIKEIAKYARGNNFAITLKHFPGYGGNVDTHMGISLDQRSQEEIQTESLPPFQAGIEEKAPIIMVSHNKIESYDSTAPTSLSKPLHDLLRGMGFTGLILTDDLDMAAIQEDLNGENEAVKAFLAGNDLIMTSSYEEDLNALEEAIENDTIKEEDLNERVKKILAFKYQYQIIKKENLSNGG